MKKLLIFVVVILIFFTGCRTKAPVLPESEPEQPVQTEQLPVEEQPADPPEESSEPIASPVDYTVFCGNYSDAETVEGPCYTVSILSVDNETGEIELSISYVGNHSSPVYTTDAIRASIESDHTVTFEWKDSWKNQGVGTLILNPGDPSSVQLMMTVTEEAEVNRATLSTREQYKTLTRRALPEPELPELYPYEDDYFIFSQIGWDMQFVILLDWEGRVTVLTSPSEEPVQVLRVVPNVLLDDPSYSGEFCIQTIGVPKEEYAGSYYEQKAEQGEATLLHESPEHVYLLETSVTGMPDEAFCLQPEEAEKLICFDLHTLEDISENPEPHEQMLLDSELVEFDPGMLYRYAGDSRVIQPVGWDVALELPEEWIGKVTVLTTHPGNEQHNYFIIPNVVLEANITERDRAPMNSHMDYCVRLVGQPTDALYPPSETARVIHSDPEFTYYLDTNLSRSPESQENRISQQLVQKIGEIRYAELIEDFCLTQEEARTMFSAEGGLRIETDVIDPAANTGKEPRTVLEHVLEMDYSAVELCADKELLLDFLTVALTDETALSEWDKLGDNWDGQRQFYSIRGSLLPFLEELERDPALKELFLQMEQWEIRPQTMERFSFSGVDDSCWRWEAVVYPGIGVDMVGWVTPTRKELQEIAANGENSELIPDLIREQFVNFVFQDWYGQSIIGRGGSVQWFWSITEEGNPRLEVHYYSDGVQVLDEKRPYEIFILEKRNGTVSMIDRIDRHEPLPET